MVVRTAARGRPEGAPAPRRRPGQGLATQARVPRVAPLPAAGKGRRRLTIGLPVSPRHSAARARGPVSGRAPHRGPSYGADASSPSWLLCPASFLPSVLVPHAAPGGSSGQHGAVAFGSRDSAFHVVPRSPLPPATPTRLHRAPARHRMSASPAFVSGCLIFRIPHLSAFLVAPFR